MIADGYGDFLTREETMQELPIKPAKSKCAICGIEADREDLLQLDKQLYCHECIEPIFENKKP
jgi:hypothetical protein